LVAFQRGKFDFSIRFGYLAVYLDYITLLYFSFFASTIPINNIDDLHSYSPFSYAVQMYFKNYTLESLYPALNFSHISAET